MLNNVFGVVPTPIYQHPDTWWKWGWTSIQIMMLEPTILKINSLSLLCKNVFRSYEKKLARPCEVLLLIWRLAPCQVGPLPQRNCPFFGCGSRKRPPDMKVSCKFIVYSVWDRRHRALSLSIYLPTYIHTYCDGFDQTHGWSTALWTPSLSAYQQYVIVAMQRLDKHPATRANNGTTSAYDSLLGNKQRANGLPR
jgi:hypothetical protein